MVYVYAISDRRALPRVAGLQGSELFSVTAGGLNAIASEHRERPEANEDGIWGHESVVEAVMEVGTVLPMRFGTVVLDASRLRRLLLARREEFKLALSRVRGAVELSVRARLPATAAAGERPVVAAEETTRPGTAYMQRRLEEARSAGNAIDLVHAPLAALSREARVSAAAPPGTLKAAYLVDRELTGEFGKAVDGLARDLEGATIACTGPWPPYGFVEGAAR